MWSDGASFLPSQLLAADFSDTSSREYWQIKCDISGMLRITVEEQHGWATIQLEGSLSGPWVEELRECWWRTLACPEHVVVNLESITSMDDAGKALLQEMHTAGTQLHGRGLMTNYILEQIQNGSRDDTGRSL